jgi:hypothetical protein
MNEKKFMDEQNKFEEWVLNYFSISADKLRSEKGYANYFVNDSWNGWKARAELDIAKHSTKKNFCCDLGKTLLDENIHTCSPQMNFEMTDERIFDIARTLGFRDAPTVRLAYDGFKLPEFARSIIAACRKDQKL